MNFYGKQLLFLDFESFYDSANGYTLKKISTLEYIKSSQFKTHGLGYAYLNGERPHWISGDHVIRGFFQSVNWGDTIVVAHNVKFDGAILAWVYGVKPKGYICTQAMARAVLGFKVKSHSLASVAEYFGFEPKGHMQTDGIRDLTPEQEAALADYCLHDVELCRSIFKTLSDPFPASQYRALDWTIKAFVEPDLALDGETLRQVNEAEKARREKIFEEIGIQKKVFSSNDKFAKLLAERGYEVPMKLSPSALKKGIEKQIPALAVGDEGFQELLHSENPELEALCEARVAAKSTLLETRSAKFLRLVPYGSFPFDVQFSGAKQTHRYSGSDGAGGNPQNLQKCQARTKEEHKSPEHFCRGQLRKAVRAPDGCSLLVADFAAVEARIVAFIAREPKLIDAFTRNEDVYSAFATRIYQRPITKADTRERQFGKTCILGLGYNMGSSKFAYKVKLDTGMVIDKEEAKRVVGLYRTYYSRIPALWQLLDHYIPFLAGRGYARLPGIPFLSLKNGCVILPSGLSLQYPNLRWEPDDSYWGGQWIYDVWEKGKLEKRHLYGGKLLENISQALAGEFTKLAIERAEDAGIKIAAQIHDEVIAVVPTEVAKHKAVVLEKCMEGSPVWWPAIKLKAEVGIGPNWLEAKA